MFRHSTQQPSIILLVIYVFLTCVSEAAANGKEKKVMLFFQLDMAACFLFFCDFVRLFPIYVV